MKRGGEPLTRRQKRERRNRRRCLAAGAVLIFGLIGLGIWRLNVGLASSSGSAAASLQTKTAISQTATTQTAAKISTNPAGDQILAKMPAELSALNQKLGLTNTTVEVAAVDLSGGGRSFSYNAAKQITSASTYKLFVAAAEISSVESGQMTWNSGLDGTTLSNCFDKMILKSDNNCPKAWLKNYGYQNLTKFARGLGASDQTAFAADNMRTDAADLALILTKIYNGQIGGSADTAKLLTDMKRQIYRRGIPTGLKSSAVAADKVGFLDGFLHDAAIVYPTDGRNYVLVIMTNNASWNYIAQLSSWIQHQMA
ncbi:MAG: class A beta-lactamase-related serine hydrolase [Candidatus Nomurabacteria bacterium]|nr:class A beta-lactamase-related serine hydrolase [Candidatus Nomurabacteria bacterium]